MSDATHSAPDSAPEMGAAGTSKPPTLVDEALKTLRDPATIRARCAAITAWVDHGESPRFRIDRRRLDAVAKRVATLTQARFPDLRIPYHSRWRHFETGGVDRKAALDAHLAAGNPETTARARIDLTLVSVLLDGGAGPDWRYRCSASGRTHARSEGLAIASYDAFVAGRFSSDSTEPCRVDADALLAISAQDLRSIFQVGTANPMIGLEGRAELLRRLGAALRERPDVFSLQGRPGHLFDALSAARYDPPTDGRMRSSEPRGHAVRAPDLLAILLDTLSGIWPSGQWLQHAGIRKPLGDVWPHAAAGGTGAGAGRVPFHKLTQWLTYSLIEPFEWAGLHVTGIEALTALPEYRNGGLLLDAGVIVPRDRQDAAVVRSPADPWIIEWRALTVSLIDEVAARVRAELSMTAAQLPLPCVLEGGTWAAGRQIASERRLGGAPPVQIDSDGTLF